MNKKASTFLTENLIFIILNLIFFVIVVAFIASQGNSAGLVEQNYAKQIALVLDSAKPGMTITLNMQKAYDISSKNEIDFDKIVGVEENIVRVKLSDRTGREYSFFKDLNVVARPEEDDNYEYTGNYVFLVTEAENEQ